jgi:GH15 family glucan-1,4-alpha-glucosidase
MFPTWAFRSLVIVGACLWPFAAIGATPLVTGNGFGFAVVAPDTGKLTKFYAHPYSFERPDPHDPLSEGIETANFVKGIGWGDGTAENARIDYVNDSHVIRVRNGAGEGVFFMPFGIKRDVLILRWGPSAAAPQSHLQVEWSHPVQSRRAVQMFGAEMQVLRFEGIRESLLLVPLGAAVKSVETKEELSTSRGWALISLEDEREVESAAREFNLWRAGLAPEALAQRELEEVERWRAKPWVKFTSNNERHLWRQSEIFLRMAQSREPNRPGRYSNGLIVAALPDGSWFMPWARDMGYAAMALLRMGHRDEARSAILAYFNARPTGKMKEETGGATYQVSVVRYFGDGSEEPFFTNEGSTNIEFDNWGQVLWLLAEYLKYYDDPALLRESTYRGPLYECARDYIAKPLLANTEKYGDGLIIAADTSIWEERQKDKKHFAYSTAMAVVGLRDFAEVARRAGDERTRADLLEKAALLEKGFNVAFVRGGTLHGTLEEGVKNDIDGALLVVINFGLVKDPAVVQSTVDRMELLKVASGGYRRVRCTYTDPSIYEYWYEREEFLFVNFMLAEVHRTMGRNDEAAAILKRMVNKSALDHNIVPEMYVAVDCKLFHGAIGDPTGATPMVGYGAGAYILHLLQREESQRNH